LLTLAIRKTKKNLTGFYVKARNSVLNRQKLKNQSMFSKMTNQQTQTKNHCAGISISFLRTQFTSSLELKQRNYYQDIKFQT